MDKTNKELLHLEHNHPSSQDALLVLNHRRKSLEEKVPKFKGLPFTPLPHKSQVLGKVKDFLGVISEANKNLQLNAKDKPEEYDIEVLKGNESEYIEMDLMLGVADLHTSEAVEAAEAAVAGNQPIFDLVGNANSSESEGSSDDDDDDEEDESDGDDNNDEHRKRQSKERPKSKRPKIVELS